jgi:hypothetical protein
MSSWPVAIAPGSDEGLVLRAVMVLAYNPTHYLENDKIQFPNSKTATNGGSIVESSQWQSQTTR